MATHTTKKRPAEEAHYAGYAELCGKRRAVPAKGRRTIASFSDAELVAGFTGKLTRFSGMGFSSAEQLELLDREAAAVCASLDDVDATAEGPASLDVMDAATEGPAPSFAVVAEATPAPHRPAYSSLSPAGAVTAAAGVASSIAACGRW